MSIHDEEVLGKAYDAVLMRRLLGYLWPYRLQAAVALASIVCASVLQLAQPYLMKLAIDRYIATADLAGLDRIALAFLAILLGSFAPRVSADVGAPDDRAAHHVRHAHADLRAPPAHRSAVLRSQSRRPPDDARDDGCRRAERSVHGRRRVHLRRHLHAPRHHDRARRDGLAAGAASRSLFCRSSCS